MLAIRSHGIDGAILDRLASRIRTAHDAPALEPAAGHARPRRRCPSGRVRRCRAVPTGSSGSCRTRRDHQTIVLSSSPRSARSCSSVAIALSISGSFRAHRREVVLVRVPAFVVDRDERHAFSTSRRAARHDWPNVFRP